MQIEFENLSNNQFISSFGDNYIIINNKKYFKNTIIFKNNILQNINEELLFSSDFIKKKINEFNINYDNFIIFGVGKNIQPLPNETKKHLINSKIPYETMISISAIKTYNILLSQNREPMIVLKLTF